jgi:hypothetical protein
VSDRTRAGSKIALQKKIGCQTSQPRRTAFWPFWREKLAGQQHGEMLVAATAYRERVCATHQYGF